MREDGFRFYRGRSMAGTFRPGDCLWLEKVSLDDVRPGDVVVFGAHDHENRPKELVHRLVAAVSGGFVAQGDNNPSPDSVLVTGKNFVGRVPCFERHGRVRRVLGGRLGLIGVRVRRCRRALGRLARCILSWPYRCLRGSRVVPRFWHPSFVRVHIETPEGPLVKYAHNGRTVAWCRPHTGRLLCRRPYDLVLPASIMQAPAPEVSEDSEVSPPPSEWLHTDLP